MNEADRLRIEGRLAVAFFLFYVATIPLFWGRLYEQGDEPNYLAMTASAAEDLDFDLSNQGGSGRSDIPSQAIDRSQCVFDPSGAVYPIHNVGLPILLAPFHALGGRMGIQLALAFFAALAVGETFRLCARLCKGNAAPLAAAGAAGLSAPFVLYAHHLYPAALLALFGAWAGRLLLWPKGETPTGRGLALVGLAAVMPAWMNYKNAAFTAAVLAIALFRLGKRIKLKSIVPLSVGPAASLAAVVALNLSMYGRVAIFSEESGRFTAPWAGAIGFFVDQAFGVIASAPFFLLTFAGFRVALKKRPDETKILALLTLSVFLPTVCYKFWHGNWSPPGRYLLEMAPFFAAVIALALEQKKMVVFKIVFLFALLLGLYFCWMYASFSALNFTNPGSGSKLLAWSGWLHPLTTLAPRLSTAPAELGKGLIWMVGILALNAVSILPWKNKSWMSGVKFHSSSRRRL